MQAVIAVPSIHDFYFTPSRASALGAEALRIILSDCGIESEIFNFPASPKKTARLQLPAMLEHLKPHIISGENGPLSFFSSYRRFGPSASDCAHQIASKNPQLVLISCFAWAYAQECIELAAELKKLKPEIQIVAGGAGVTVNPAFFESCLAIDCVLPGEAERVIPDFLNRQLPHKDSPGFIWYETGISQKKNTRFISAILSRGCPKTCRFCANYLVHGRRYRRAEIEEVEYGIKQFPEQQNIHINFEDDNLLTDKEFFYEVLRTVKTRFPFAGFSAENGLDYSYMDENSIHHLINSGFRSFNFSMASSSSSLLSNENRSADIKRLKLMVETAAAEGISTTTYFICGLENDTPETTVDNLLTLHELPTLTGISMFYPVPGLPGFDSDKLSAFPPGLCAGSSAWPWNRTLSTEQLITAFRLSRLSNLIKTIENRIRLPEGRLGIHESALEILKKTLATGRLHTLSGKKLVQVPHQNDELVSAFLAALSID